MTYFLASSGAVFEDPIKADPNWPRVLVIDPEDEAAAEAFARAYIDVHDYARKPWEARQQENRDTVIRDVQAAFRAMLVEPPKVFAHYPRWSDDPRAMCGKLWRPPTSDTNGIERCPECVELVEGGWVA